MPKRTSHAGVKTTKRRANGHALAMKRIVGEDGKILEVLVVDANSQTFAEDLRYAFEQNVKRVRLESRRNLTKSASKKRQ